MPDKFRGTDSRRVSSFSTTAAGRFTNIAHLLGIAFEFDGRGAASDDLDGDGRPDLVMIEYRSERIGKNEYHLHVLRNEWDSENSWIGVRLQEEAGQPSPLGATIRMRRGERTWIQSIVTGDSFSTQHATKAHFRTRPGRAPGLDRSGMDRWPEVTDRKPRTRETSHDRAPMRAGIDRDQTNHFDTTRSKNPGIFLFREWLPDVENSGRPWHPTIPPPNSSVSGPAIRRRLGRYVFMMIPRGADAAEVLQDVSVLLWQKWDRYDQERPFVPWAIRFAPSRDPQVAAATGTGETGSSPGISWSSCRAATRRGSPLMEARRQALGGCLNRLSDQQRKWVALRYGRHGAVKEEAERSGVSMHKLYYALEKIRSQLLDCIETRSGGRDGAMPESRNSTDPNDHGELDRLIARLVDETITPGGVLRAEGTARRQSRRAGPLPQLS